MATYLYMIGEARRQHPFKIGVAICPLLRLSDLQTGNPRRLKLVKTWKLPTFAHAREVEREIHEHFAARRVLREWFDVDPTQACEFIEWYLVGYRRLRAIEVAQ